MGAGKWIGGILGFMTMGPLGALAGFALGSLLDGNNGLFGNTYEKGQAEAGNYDEGQRNSFLFSMLVMASYIIRADGVSIRPRACFSPSYNKVKSQTKHVWLLTLL